MDEIPRIYFSLAFCEKIHEYCDEALKKLYENFVDPLNRNYEISELPGKYKPSWELQPNCTNTMRDALAKAARKNNLHHYHFGYPFYRDGRDPKYAGYESDGIVHTSIHYHGAIDQHIIFKIDETHPTPFTIPTDLRIYPAANDDKY